MTEQELQQLLRSNPDLKAPGFECKQAMTPAAKAWLEADARKLEERFLAWWQAIGGQELEREYRFAPDRKFRADFCHLGSKVIVEIHGSVFSQGRHTRPQGFISDREKMLIAQRLGWFVIELATGFTLEQVEEVLDVVVERSNG